MSGAVLVASPSSAHAVSIWSANLTTNCPLPSYPPRVVLSTKGSPNLSAAAWISALLCTAIKGTVAISNLLNKFFSFNRSCATDSANDDGYKVLVDSKNWAGLSGVFSNSRVKISLLWAKSSNCSLLNTLPSKRAGQLALSSKNTQRIPSGNAACANIIPSCPPPKIPMVLTG